MRLILNFQYLLFCNLLQICLCTMYIWCTSNVPKTDFILVSKCLSDKKASMRNFDF